METWLQSMIKIFLQQVDIRWVGTDGYQVGLDFGIWKKICFQLVFKLYLHDQKVIYSQNQHRFNLETTLFILLFYRITMQQ